MKVLKIVALLCAILLIVGVGLIANAFLGNPVSKFMATSAAEQYLEKNYPDTDYEIDSVAYSFKTGSYYAHIKSASLPDGDFTVTVSMGGKIENDDYGSRVDGKGNVANRLFMEYKEAVEKILESHAYPYDVSMGFGDLEFEREVGKEMPEGAIARADLENGKIYNVGELGKTNGTLVLYIDSETVSYEKAAEILLKTKELTDEVGIFFYCVDFVLRYPPYDSESYERPEGNIRINEFLYADIYEQGLEERLEENQIKTDEYYEKLDK